MADKTIKTRILQKTDTSANWAKAVNFIPKKGELIVYSDLRKIKIGDGETKVTTLPFLADSDTHQSIKVLNTNNTTTQSPSTNETINGNGTINLHKIAKTGSYSDLLDKPTIPTSDVAEIILSDSQMVEININKITFTEAQFNIIKQASYIKFMYNDNEVISGVVNFFSTAEIYTISCFFISLDGLRATLMSIPTNYDYSQLDISIVSIAYDIRLYIDAGINSFSVWSNEEKANYPIYFDTINGKSILHTDSTINEYTIPTITFED